MDVFLVLLPAAEYRVEEQGAFVLIEFFPLIRGLRFTTVFFVLYLIILATCSWVSLSRSLK